MHAFGALGEGGEKVSAGCKRTRVRILEKKTFNVYLSGRWSEKT